MSNETSSVREVLTGVLCDWEDNGYDDSDFYVSRWNAETGAIEAVLVGTTRGYMLAPAQVLATDDEVLAARAAAEREIFDAMRKAHHADVFEPQSVGVGDKVAVAIAHKAKDKAAGTTVELKVGDVGRVFWAKAMGTFHRNGYNRPGRDNIRVGIELADGRRAFLPLKKLRMAAEPRSDESLRAEAVRHSWTGTWAFRGKAWSSSNHAAYRLRALRPVPFVD